MKNVRFLILMILFSHLSIAGFTQYKKNAVVAEIAGKSFSFFGLEYERFLTERFRIGTGIGIGSKEQLVYGNGDTFDRYNFSVPVYGVYAWGRKKHHAITEFGFTLRGVTGPVTKASFDEFYPYVSYGYEFKSDIFVFRIPVYLCYVGSSDFFPAVIPWLGLSFGVVL